MKKTSPLLFLSLLPIFTLHICAMEEKEGNRQETARENYSTQFNTDKKRAQAAKCTNTHTPPLQVSVESDNTASDMSNTDEISDDACCSSLFDCFGFLFGSLRRSEEYSPLAPSNSRTAERGYWQNRRHRAYGATDAEKSSSSDDANNPFQDVDPFQDVNSFQKSYKREKESWNDRTLGGIFNPYQNCFVNASLQAYKTAALASEIVERNHFPRLSHFLTADLLTRKESQELHVEMIKFMQDQDIYHELKSLEGLDGVIDTQYDAGEFLSALLQTTEFAPVFFEKRFRFPDGFEKSGDCTQPDSFLRLSIEMTAREEYTIQELVDANLQSNVLLKRKDNSPENEAAIKQLFLPQNQAPRILFVQIARYFADYTRGGLQQKLTCRISKLANSILLPELPSQDNPSRFIEYEPLAFICHIGPTLHEGHYVAYCKRNGGWIKYDDNQVANRMTTSDAQNIQKNSYIIVYQKKETSTTAAIGEDP